MNNHSARTRPGKRGLAKARGGDKAGAANGKRAAAAPSSKAEGKGAPDAGKSKRAADAERKAEPKRERILDAAIKVFAAEGFYNAKVSQIAQAAGVADGTIYLYFKSK